MERKGMNVKVFTGNIHPTTIVRFQGVSPCGCSAVTGGKLWKGKVQTD